MAKKTPSFRAQVKKALSKKTPQSSTDIARKLGLIGDEDTAQHYQAVKTRKMLKQLVADEEAIHEGSRRTSVYYKA